MAAILVGAPGAVGITYVISNEILENANPTQSVFLFSFTPSGSNLKPNIILSELFIVGVSISWLIVAEPLVATSKADAESIRIVALADVISL